nr:hypothetical protein [Tanacetum cinerariifolium]
ERDDDGAERPDKRQKSGDRHQSSTQQSSHMNHGHNNNRHESDRRGSGDNYHSNNNYSGDNNRGSDNSQGNVIAAEPTRLQDVIRIANNLMDQKLKGYAARNAENKRSFENSPRDNRVQQPPFKR